MSENCNCFWNSWNMKICKSSKNQSSFGSFGSFISTYQLSFSRKLILNVGQVLYRRRRKSKWFPGFRRVGKSTIKSISSRKGVQKNQSVCPIETTLVRTLHVTRKSMYTQVPILLCVVPWDYALNIWEKKFLQGRALLSYRVCQG